MATKSLNRRHQDGLVSRIREITKEIRQAVKANEVDKANRLAMERLQLCEMANAAMVPNIRVMRAMGMRIRVD